MCALPVRVVASEHLHGSHLDERPGNGEMIESRAPFFRPQRPLAETLSPSPILSTILPFSPPLHSRSSLSTQAEESSRRRHRIFCVSESIRSVLEEAFDKTTACVLHCGAEDDQGSRDGEEASWPTPPHDAATTSSFWRSSSQASSLLLSSLPCVLHLPSI